MAKKIKINITLGQWKKAIEAVSVLKQNSGKTEEEIEIKLLSDIVEKELKDYTWGIQDYKDTIRRIKTEEVIGLFYLDNEMVKKLNIQVQSILKEKNKTEKQLNKTKETKESLNTIQKLIRVSKKTGQIEINKEIMKNLFKIKSKELKKNKKELSKKEGVLIEKLSNLEDKLSNTKDKYEKISVYGYQSGKKGEIIDLVSKQGENFFGQKTFPNDLLAEALLLTNQIKEINFEKLIKKYIENSQKKPKPKL